MWWIYHSINLDNKDSVQTFQEYFFIISHSISLISLTIFNICIECVRVVHFRLKYINFGI